MLRPAEVQRLHALAELFEVDGLNEHVAPEGVAVAVAEVAGGPVEDFTGHGRPMPLELWSCVLGKVDFTAPVADVLVAAVENYRREAPRYWRNLHPSSQPNRSGLAGLAEHEPGADLHQVSETEKLKKSTRTNH